MNVSNPSVNQKLQDLKGLHLKYAALAIDRQNMISVEARQTLREMMDEIRQEISCLRINLKELSIND